MAKTGIGTLSVFLALLLFALHATGQTPRELLPGIAAPYVGSPLTCSSSEKERIVVRNRSLREQSSNLGSSTFCTKVFTTMQKGIVNIDREKR